MVERDKSRLLDDIFAIPVLNRFLIYAPLHGFAALADQRATHRIRDGLLSSKSSGVATLDEIIHTLKSDAQPRPRPREGDLAPAFLGLIPTRDCNLACKYCGFLTAEESSQIMEPRLAREAIDWYLDLVRRSGNRAGAIHFFGGEPFCAEEVVDFVFHFAKLKAAEASCSISFEVATNGTFDQARCRWVADSLDSIILSMDGPPDIHDHHRQRKDGRGSSEAVVRSAKILSQGTADLSIRVCVTDETVDRMPEIAVWLCQEFRPVSVSFEPIQPSVPSKAAGLLPPDPWDFASNFVEASWLLEAQGVEAVYAAADIHTRRVSFCPVGQDVPIVSPDGTLTACYLLRQDWEAKGLNLQLGQITNGSVSLDASAVEETRSLNVWNKPFCARCFGKWHCAGGCHVNHAPPSRAGDYDGLCIQTRILTLRNILRRLERDDLMRQLLQDSEALEKAALQASDMLVDVGKAV
jgi:uncharacterized protein